MSKSWKGDLAEQLFVLQALESGLIVSRPFQASSRYDFIVDNSRLLFKIQVKSVFTPPNHKGAFICFVSRYAPGDFDYLAAYINDEKKFFIIPFNEIFSGRLQIFPSDLKNNGFNLLR